MSRPSSSASCVSLRSSASSSAIKMVIGMALSFIGFIRGLTDGQRHDERRALACGALCHNRPSVAICYFSAKRQANTGPLIFAATVQALENDKDAFRELFIESNAVVPHLDLAHLAGGGRRAHRLLLG